MNDGGPAFPVADTREGLINAAFGMTLRDYFAAKAMQMMCAEYFKFNGACFDKDHLFQNLPGHAYRMADAMLKARATGEGH